MKNKVIFVASDPGSLLNFRLHLMQEFLSRGYEVVALAPYDKVVKAQLVKLNIRFIDIPLARNGLNPLQDLKLFFNLRTLFRAEKPGLVFAYTIKPVIYTSLAAYYEKVPAIYSLITGTGYAFLNHGLKSRVIGIIAKILFRKALRCNTKVFFQNKDNLALFIKENLLNSAHPTMIVNGSGVDCTQFALSPYPKELSFLMIARFLRDKGIWEYVNAAKILKKKYPYLKFKLVGWIDSNPNAISQKDLNSWIESGYIEYLGRLADVRQAITESSVYVLPSYHEGTSRTVLEAMAMGRPIITTDAPGCRETVIEAINGFLVPVQNSDVLVEKMEYFINNPRAIIEMGRESRKLAEEKFDVHKVNRVILNTILGKN